MKKKFPFYKQLDAMDCGPTCLQMICKFYGKSYSIITLRKFSDIQKQGTSVAGLINAAEIIGFNTLPVKIEFKDIMTRGLPLPCVLYWNQNHFVVLTQIKKRRNAESTFYISDPGAEGPIIIDEKTFRKCWIDQAEKGIALLVEPTVNFYSEEADAETSRAVSWSVLWKYIAQHKKYFLRIALSLLAASLFQLLLPFLTQGIVDKGVNMSDINFVYIALIAQLVLLVARFIVEFSRQSLLLFISTNVNLSLLTDFWKKLMHLPISYFDSKQTGDIMQRLNDQRRIESFLTGNSINIIFSAINLVVYSFVMLVYSAQIFFIFAVGSSCYMLWVSVFLRQRRKLNYKQFDYAARENSATMQMIFGMQEIKLHNAETFYRHNWNRLQRGLFSIAFKNMSLSQTQQAGAILLNEGKNILVTGIVAGAVIKGELTLGSMLAIQYILGALNGPVQQFTGFVQDLQDARISLERLNEIHMEKDEALPGSGLGYSLSNNTGITIKNLSFGYYKTDSEKVLKNINLKIPEGKVTAIVGMSGSGKTTLLKILQKFYDDKYSGEIKVGENTTASGTELKLIIPADWRAIVGAVMQDGYIFYQTIAGNIAVGEETPDTEKLLYATRMANILPFIETLPLGFDTKIGMEGVGISMGQKQRLLIARAIYKDPKIIFFDEATNSLDANNEKVILENLDAFFSGRTVVVVAHRLSTVRNADKIVVLHQGEIVEEGTHDMLTCEKGHYYELVKNQLELGN